MGGWSQYSCSATTSAWLAQHFYLHWRYSQDQTFLKERAYPWIKDVAIFLKNHSVVDKDGIRSLLLSASPEINDNRITAWFRETTNYDLALVRWLFKTAEELADILDLKNEANEWKNILHQWPEFAKDKEDARLLVAPNYPLKESHRHFSHLMAIHPLGLIDKSHGGKDSQTIDSSLKELERLGPDWWCGYSYAWQGNMEARAFHGEKAAMALRTFAECFCLPNTFHANGDQTKSGKSKMTYRPFTLEGNFAFAAGVQEMLLQSHAGVIKVFPAIPVAWKNAAFTSLRAEGAFLLSAKKEEGKVVSVVIQSEKGGLLVLDNPFENREIQVDGNSKTGFTIKDKVIEIPMKPEQTIILKAVKK